MAGIKNYLRKMVPSFLRDAYWRLARRSEHKRNLQKTPEEVFTTIYEQNQWGGSGKAPCSGDGSRNEEAISAYISKIAQKASAENFQDLTFVDLGCGDFHLGRQLLGLCKNYIGVDVVKALIEHHQKEYGNTTTQFQHLDLVQDPLPDGEVCFIRQVLQHLSNDQIARILQKLKKYRWVFITEHYPKDNAGIHPNKDKVHGSDIRLYENSGVYLDKPPFNLPSEKLELLLEVAGVGVEGKDSGVIRTFLYKPTAK